MSDPLSRAFSGERLPASSYGSLSQSFSFDGLQARFLKKKFSPDSVADSVKHFLHNSFSQVSTSQKHANGPFTNQLIEKVTHILTSSNDVDSELCTVLNNLEPDVIRRLLFNRGALPYPAYRAYLRLVGQQKAPVVDQASRDIDEAIIENNDYLTRNIPDDERHLLTVSDLKRMLIADGASLSCINADDSYFSFKIKRKSVQAVEIPVLDEHRPENVTIHSGAPFLKAFRQITRNCLDTLDWANVLAAGSVVTASLLEPSPFYNNPAWYMDDDGGMSRGQVFYWPELHLYGLDHSQATTKLHDIFEAWKRNLPDDTGQARVLRSLHYVYFFEGDRRQPSFRVSLKLRPSKTAVLLDCVYDPFAVGFDGTEVYMIPRCARALETGYLMMSSKIIFAQSQFLGPRFGQPSIELSTCASMGFGLRIPSILSRTLEDSSLEPTITQQFDATQLSEPENPQPPTDARLAYGNLQTYRQPHGEESGHKTLRRIAFLGQDKTNRVFFGPTPLSTCLDMRGAGGHAGQSSSAHDSDVQGRKRHLLKRLLSQSKPTCLEERGQRPFNPFSNPPGYSTDEDDDDDDDDDEVSEVEGVEDPNDTLRSHNRRLDASVHLPPINCFESLISHCEAWRLGVASFESNLGSSWNHIASVDRGEPFSVENLDPPAYQMAETSIEEYLTHRTDFELYQAIDFFVEFKTGVSAGSPRQYVNYFTGRARVGRSATHVNGTLNRDLKLPIVLTKELEDFLTPLLPAGTLQPAYDCRAHSDPGRNYRGRIPPLAELNEPTSAGNLRYFVIGRNMMWTGIDEVVDRTYEACRLLSGVFCDGEIGHDNEEDYKEHMESRVAASLLSRPSSLYPQISAEARWRGTGLPLREAMLFRAWAMASPLVDRGDVRRTRYGYRHDARKHLYPVPEELFWGPEFEGGAMPPMDAEVSKSVSNMPEKPWWFRAEAYKDLLS